MLNGQATESLLIAGLIKRTHKLVNIFLNWDFLVINVKVELDLSNHGTKADLKKRNRC